MSDVTMWMARGLWLLSMLLLGTAHVAAQSPAPSPPAAPLVEEIHVPPPPPAYVTPGNEVAPEPQDTPGLQHARYATPRIPARPGPEPSAVPTQNADATFEGQLGGYYSGQSYGYSTAFAGYLRYSALQIGVRAGTTSEFWLESTYSLAPLAGLAFQVGRLRLDLMGLIGLRHYSDVGSDFDIFSPDPGADATLGFAGATWGLSYVVGRPATDLYMLVGVRAQIDRDLKRVTRNYTFIESSFLFGDDTEVMRSVKIGTTTYAVSITVTALTPL